MPFKVDTAALTAGRRLARHEYPQRDIPYLEDLGKKAREYKVEAFVLGDDFMAQRDELLRAIESPGAGQLVHPYFGTLQVVVSGETQVTQSTREGGIARFSLVFVEAGQQLEPQSGSDAEAVMTAQAGIANEASASDFATSFSVDGAQDFVVTDAVSSVNEILGLPSMAMANPGWIRANPQSALTVLLPENLPSSLADPLSLASGLQQLVGAATDVDGLLGFSLDAVSTDTLWTASRQRQASNRQALTDLLRQSATVARILALAGSRPATIDEARLARQEITARTDAVLLSATTGQKSADALVQLRTEAINCLRAQTVDLPRLVAVTSPVALPAVVLAHANYGDAWLDEARDDDLIARNRIRHPGFVPGGQVLQLLSA